MKILIGGDVCPVGRNEQSFANPELVHSLRQFYVGTDLLMVNLECPLVKQSTPILKGGPVLGACTEAVVGLIELGIDIVGLANNHIMDHGLEGLQTTIEVLHEAGILTVGAGDTIHRASQPLRTHIGNNPVTVFAFAELEYSQATSNRAGACPLNLNLVVRALRNVPKDTVCIVLLHGGNEHYPYPNPWLQDTCRLMVELGADVVVCQHSHCIGAYEVYKDALIVYGQGNLVFDLPSQHQAWWQGLLVGVEFNNGNLVDFEFIPVVQEPGAKVIRQANGNDRAEILNELEIRSKVLGDPQQLEQQWQKFCREQKRLYQTLLFGFNRMFHIANKITGIADFLPRRGQMNIGNVLRCASHLEVLKTIYSLEHTTGEGNHGK